ncbi:MAG: hypothetical protein ACOYPS_05240 [Phycisphaerales bacterium]
MKATNDMTNTSGTRRATGWSCACLLLLTGQATAQPGGQPPMIRAIPIVRMPAAQPPEPPEESAKAADGESSDAPEGAVKPDAKKDASVALPPEEVAELKAAWEAASPEEQAELRAYYADLGVDVDKALGLDAAKGEAQARAMELQGAMREMEFARTPQAVLAARSKLAFGQVPQPNASSASPMDVARWVHLQAMAGEWGVLGEWLRQRPEAESQGIYSTILGRIALLTGTENTTVNFTVVFLLAMAAPIALLAAASFASSRLSGGDMLRDFTIFGYALIPLDLAAHMAHNLFHLMGEGLAVPRSLVLWLGGTWKGSTAILNTATIEVLQYLMLGAGIAATVYAAYRIAGSVHGTAKWRALVPQLLLVALLVAINVYMFTQPMSHRA